MDEIEFVKNMQTLEIRENDILIVKLDRIVSENNNKIITDNVRNNLPDNIKRTIKVFVLEPGVDIDILRSKDCKMRQNDGLCRITKEYVPRRKGAGECKEFKRKR